MTMRLDIVTSDAGELVRREHARELGANVVVSLYRLARLSQLHDLGNQAFVRQLEQTHNVITDYCLRAGTNVNILFAEKAVFVSGQLLRGSREKYELASELGEIFAWCGGSELTIARDVTQGELLAFAEAISVAMRGEKGRGFRSPTLKIRLRAVNEAARHRGLDVETLSDEQRIVRNYASAIVILRRFFDDLAASRYVLPRRIKRVAQNLVDLSAGSTPAFLGVTEVRNANHDDAGRAVNTAILAVAMAREMTSDKGTLVQIAMAAMMHDVGRPRASALAAAGAPRMSQLVARLSEDAEDRMPAGAAAVLTALGRVNEPSITRTVLAFEALWIRRSAFLGPVYRGARAPTLHARIIAIARRYNDIVTPEPGLEPKSADYAIATLSEEITEPADRTLLRMLVSALGLFPVGTVVQLASGEVAEVIFGAERTSASGKPRVRIVMDANGGVLASPLDIDLARATEARKITRVMSVDGWRKGRLNEPDRAPPKPSRQTQEPSAPSRSAVMATEPRIPIAAPWMDPPAASPAPAPPIPMPSPSTPTVAPPRAEGGARGDTRGPIPSITNEAFGTSASEIADAMGRMIEEALRGTTPNASPALTSAAANAPAPEPAEPQKPKGKAPTMPAPVNVPIAPSVPAAQSATQSAAVAPSAKAETKAADRASAVPPSIQAPSSAGPTARGTLGTTPLAHVLVYMLDHALTGSVVFTEPGGDESVIYFLNGAANKVRIAHPAALLGDELVAAGMLRRDALPEAVEGARRLGVLFGEYLVGHDLVTREALARALEAQVGNKVAAIVNLVPETTYSFFRDVDLLAAIDSEGVVCDPLNVILATVRAWHDRARIQATLARIMKHTLVFHAQSDPASLVLTPDERTLLDTIRASRSTLAQLAQMRIASDDVLSSLVYMFAVTRQFAFKGQKKPPMAGRGTAIPISIAPPASMGGSPESMRIPPDFAPNSLRAPPKTEAPEPPLAADTTPPSALDAPSDGGDTRPPPATDLLLAGAIVDAARTAPPPGERATLPPSRPQASSRGPTLTPPPPLTERPRARLDSSADAGHEAGPQLQAMTHFRMAESALQRGDVAQAEKLAQRATKADPEHGDYLALYTWIRAMGTHTDTGILEAIVTLNKIVENDANERALLYRGKLWKRMKKMREALRDFQRVLEINPRHREAASEVRLIKQSRAK